MSDLFDIMQLPPIDWSFIDKLNESHRNHMESQIGLKPASHRNDPSTSHKAEEGMNKGKRQTHAQKVYWLVCRYPGLTASDYAHLAPRHALFPAEWSVDKLLIEIRRRLSDMNGSMVIQGDKRKGRNNTDEITWKAK